MKQIESRTERERKIVVGCIWYIYTRQRVVAIDEHIYKISEARTGNYIVRLYIWVERERVAAAVEKEKMDNGKVVCIN